MSRNVLIVPFYNEQLRIKMEMFDRLINSWEGHIVLIDDGSTDGTYELLTKLESSKVSVLKLEVNSGKSEALRHAMQRLKSEFSGGFIFSADCDFSVPIEDLIEFKDSVLKRASTSNLSDNSLIIFSSSRISINKHVKVNIERNLFRDLIGFAIRRYIKWLSSCPAKDPQSPVKAYFVNDALESVCTKGLKTRWFLDIEFLLSAKAFGLQLNWQEFQLPAWKDIPTKNYSGTLAFFVLTDLLNLFRLRLAIS